MPILYGFLDPSEKDPGFILPLFRSESGSNVDLTQVVDLSDVVCDFIEFTPPGSMVRHATDTRVVSVGDSAIWALKDKDGTVWVGTSAEMKEIATRALEGGGLKGNPLLQLDLESFSGVTRDRSKVLLDAFSHITRRDGPKSASIWRDSEILAPAARRDLAYYIAKRNLPTVNTDLVAIYRDNLNIFLSADLKRAISRFKWPATRKVLSNLRLNPQIVIRDFREFASDEEGLPIWRAYGLGGVARFVLKAAPFFGRIKSYFGGELGIEARGRLPVEPDQRRNLNQLFAVSQSTEDSIQKIAKLANEYPRNVYIRHLINVRPFSFGSPPRNRLPASGLIQFSDFFDYVWIVTNHRQRWNSSYRNQLSVTNAASRQVRSLLLSITRNSYMLNNRDAGDIMHPPQFSLSGSVRANAQWTIDDVVRSLLHAMLCEEAPLHSAKKIYAFAPRPSIDRLITVRLGNHSYDVEIIHDFRRARSADFIGWAIGVKLSEGSKNNFYDFCIALMHGYGWKPLESYSDSLLLANRDRTILIYIAYDARDIEDTLAKLDKLELKDRGFHVDGHAILTSITVTPRLEKLARESGYPALHYSRIPGWLEDNFDSFRFDFQEFD